MHHGQTDGHPKPPSLQKKKPPLPLRPPPPRRPPLPQGEGWGEKPDDPVVGPVVHIPYPGGGGSEMGTIRRVYCSKAGAVWVEYLGSTTLYEVARGLLFPTPKAAKEHVEDARKGEGKPKPKPLGQTDPKTNEPADPKTNPPTDPSQKPTPTLPSHPLTPPNKMPHCWTPRRGPKRNKGPPTGAHSLWQ